MRKKMHVKLNNMKIEKQNACIQCHQVDQRWREEFRGSIILKRFFHYRFQLSNSWIWANLLSKQLPKCGVGSNPSKLCSVEHLTEQAESMSFDSTPHPQQTHKI